MRQQPLFATPQKKLLLDILTTLEIRVLDMNLAGKPEFSSRMLAKELQSALMPNRMRSISPPAAARQTLGH